jgi:surface protein
MNDTASKLNKLLETKAAIRQAIIDKGVEVGEDTVFADYPTKIAAIETSGGSDDFLALRTNNNTNYNSLFAFYEGESIESFGIDTWDTSNVTNMSSMFQNCGSLTELDLSNFNTGNVRDISAIFVYCVSLETLDIRNFDLTRAFSYSYMIIECPKLHTLRLDNCSNDTISKIIGSDGFPTGTIDGVTRKLYCKQANAEGLTLPDGWEFVYVD